MGKGICERIGQLITQMVRSTKDSLNGLARNMNTIGNEMSNNLINGISGAVTGIAGILNEVVSKVNSTIGNVNSSLSGIEKAFTFSYDVTTPDGKRRWGKYSMNLPRVNTVPYLAKGAVIPPRSEFLRFWEIRNRAITSRRRRLCSEKLFVKKLAGSGPAAEAIVLQLRLTAEHCLTR